LPKPLRNAVRLSGGIEDQHRCLNRGGLLSHFGLSGLIYILRGEERPVSSPGGGDRGEMNPEFSIAPLGLRLILPMRPWADAQGFIRSPFLGLNLVKHTFDNVNNVPFEDYESV